MRKQPHLRTRASKLRLRHASKPGTPGKEGILEDDKDIAMGGTVGAGGIVEGIGAGGTENGTPSRIVAEAAETLKVREFFAGADPTGGAGAGESAWVPTNTWVAVNASGSGNDSRSGSAPPTGTSGASNDSGAGRVSALSHILRLDEDATRTMANTAAALSARPAGPLLSGSPLRDLSDEEIRTTFLHSLDAMYERQMLPEIVAALAEKNLMGAIAERLRGT